MNTAIFTRHHHWPAVSEVCATLRNEGYQAWLAGGCVRDAYLGRVPQDFDVATNARPEAVEKLFSRALTVGKQFGVIIIPFEGFQVEVTTFRSDGTYADGRRPENIVFSSPEDDAKRRDFTINALFFDLETNQVLDFVGGVRDLERRCLRTVGVASDRFTEDKLRILRAIRFAAQLDFEIEAQTWNSIVLLQKEVAQISRERIRDEMNKLLKCAGRVRGLELLESSGLLQTLWPELGATTQIRPMEIIKFPPGWVKPKLNLWKQTLGTMKQLCELGGEPLGLEILWGLLYCNWWKWVVVSRPDSAQKSLARLPFEANRFSNQMIEQVSGTLISLPQLMSSRQWKKSDLMRLLASSYASTLLSVYHYDSKFVLGSEQSWGWFMSRRKELLPDGKLPSPLLSGKDLKDQGLTSGPLMGEILREAMDLQLEGVLRSREQALKWLQGRIGDHNG